MPQLLVPVVCLLFFWPFLLVPRLRTAIILFALLLGYALLSLNHYFGGGWDAATNNHPFNRGPIFALFLLAGLAAISGFVAWLVHNRRAPFGTGRRGKFKTFAAAFGAYAILGLAIAFTLPLDFSMPVDMNLCDTATPPDYCPPEATNE